MDIKQNNKVNPVENTAPKVKVLLIMVGVLIGILFAVLVIPRIMPGLADSLLGPSPKAYWYLSRVSGLVAYTLLWMSIALGLLITSKASRIWPGGPTAVDLHNFISLFGLSVAIFHVVVLLGDQYMSYTILSLLVPFASADYRPLWVGLGQIGLYWGWIVALSFYVRKRIGPRTWRVLHYGSFAVYLLVTLHGVMAGTDTSAPPIMALYLVTSGITYFLLVYRILAAVKASKHSPDKERRERKVAGHPAG